MKTLYYSLYAAALAALLLAAYVMNAAPVQFSGLAWALLLSSFVSTFAGRVIEMHNETK